MRYKLGDRVIHKNHGAGFVLAYMISDSELLVEFDVQPKGWDKEICVSTALLRPEKIREFKYLDGKPVIPRYIVGIMENVHCKGSYTYRLVGVNRNRPAYGVDADIEKLRKWAEDHGSAFKILARSYKVRNYYIEFEMTDPVAHKLEQAGLIE